ncbi:unnamed protein product, partial [Rotaria sp. Silwood1]
ALHNYLSFFGIDSLADVNIVCDRGSNFVCAFKDFEPIFCYEHRLNNIVKVTFFQNKKKQADTVVVDVKNGVDVKPFCTKTAGGNEKEIHESSSDDSELSTDDDSVNETALPVFRKKKKFVKKYLSSQNNTLSSQMKMTVDQIPLSAKHVIEVFKKWINTDIKEESGVTLHQSCIVRWLSMSNLLESILKSFKTTKRLLLARNKHSLIYDLNVLTIKQLVLVLKPVKHIVTLVQTGNSPCLHLVLLCNLTLKRALSSYGSLLDYVNTYCNSNDNLSDKCENEENENYELEGIKWFRERFLHLIDELFNLDVRHYCATMLHPKYKLLKSCTAEERSQCHKYVRQQLKILHDVNLPSKSHEPPPEPQQKKFKSADT